MWLDVTDDCAVDNAEENLRILFGVFCDKIYCFIKIQYIGWKNRKDEQDGTVRAIG